MREYPDHACAKTIQPDDLRPIQYGSDDKTDVNSNTFQVLKRVKKIGVLLLFDYMHVYRWFWDDKVVKCRRVIVYARQNAMNRKKLSVVRRFVTIVIYTCREKTRFRSNRTKLFPTSRETFADNLLTIFNVHVLLFLFPKTFAYFRLKIWK